jgi:predicted amidohydrolase
MKAHFLLPICVVLTGLVLMNGKPATAVAEESASTSRYVRIGHYQCFCQQDDFQANLKSLVRGLKLAADAKLDIVSFPESFLTGYFPKEEQARANSLSIDSSQMKEVLRRTAEFPLMYLVGFNEIRDGELFNTVAVIESGKILGCYSKAFPVIRYFKPGREFPVFEKKGLKFGVIICADGGYIEPARILAIKGAKLIFAPHYNFIADPIQHYQMVRNDHVARAIENGVYFLRGNNVVAGRDLKGWEHPGYGYGDSYLLNPNGEIVAAAGLYQEYLMIYNLDLQKQFRNQPTWRSKKSAAALMGALSEALQASGS